jgi:hypothetical protein
VKKRIWCELIQLHTVHKQPTKKFVGRKRETVEKESKEHHPESYQRQRDGLVLGKMISVEAGRNPSFLAFFRSASSKEEGI